MIDLNEKFNFEKARCHLPIETHNIDISHRLYMLAKEYNCGWIVEQVCQWHREYPFVNNKYRKNILWDITINGGDLYADTYALVNKLESYYVPNVDFMDCRLKIKYCKDETDEYLMLHDEVDSMGMCVPYDYPLHFFYRMFYIKQRGGTLTGLIQKNGLLKINSDLAVENWTGKTEYYDNRKVRCPFRSNRFCGDWCVFFGGPVWPQEKGGKVFIDICGTKLLFDELEDQRIDRSDDCRGNIWHEFDQMDSGTYPQVEDPCTYLVWSREGYDLCQWNNRVGWYDSSRLCSANVKFYAPITLPPPYADQSGLSTDTEGCHD